MIPNYNTLLAAIAKEFSITREVAERWVMYHIGEQLMRAAMEPDAADQEGKADL